MTGLELTPDELVVDAIMQWQAGYALLIVEGRSDRTILSQLLQGCRVHLAVVSSKSGALRVRGLLELEDANSVGPARVLVDRDDDLGPDCEGRLIRTVGRDLDAEIAGAPDVLLYVIWQAHQCGSRREAQELFDRVMAAAHGMRALRVVNSRRCLGMNIKAITADMILAIDTSSPRELLRLAGVDSSHADWGDLRSDLEVLISEPVSTSSCQGHDLHSLVARIDNMKLGMRAIQNQCASHVLGARIRFPTLDQLVHWLTLESLYEESRSAA